MTNQIRVGTGYDVHRLVEGRRLILGGVEIPFEKGAMGHSDADVLSHAICDALLGAAALGDIGSHFPDDDPRWSGASSLDFLAHAVELLRQEGYGVVNVDATVLLERPKLRTHIEAIRQRLASALGVSVDSVSVKAKTNEGVGPIGKGEAVAAQSIATIQREE
jgi:2-C-methyl-D-erythritol 2,4-cyclodiphosphate synthase